MKKTNSGDDHISRPRFTQAWLDSIEAEGYLAGVIQYHLDRHIREDRILDAIHDAWMILKANVMADRELPEGRDYTARQWFQGVVGHRILLSFRDGIQAIRLAQQIALEPVATHEEYAYDDPKLARFAAFIDAFPFAQERTRLIWRAAIQVFRNQSTKIDAKRMPITEIVQHLKDEGHAVSKRIVERDLTVSKRTFIIEQFWKRGDHVNATAFPE